MGGFGAFFRQREPSSLVAVILAVSHGCFQF